MFRRLHISKWLGGLFAPIEKNGAFFVFMFVLGYLCTQLEIMPYYLRDRGAKPYELSVPELFLDIYVVCVLLTLIPRKIRIFVKALLYVLFYGVAIGSMCSSMVWPLWICTAMSALNQPSLQQC